MNMYKFWMKGVLSVLCGFITPMTVAIDSLLKIRKVFLATYNKAHQLFILLASYKSIKALHFVVKVDHTGSTVKVRYE